MKYNRFEELPVWQAAIRLGVDVYALTANRLFLRQRSLRDQIERAAVSVSNNIAEGFERGTTQELLGFLYIARGSAGEVRWMLCLLERLPAFANLKSEISNLNSKPKPFPGNCAPGPNPCRKVRSRASAT
jgi:four helix bundle protein